MQEQAFKQMDFIVRYEKLEKEVIEFVKQWNDGFETGAHFTSFPAPHISKVSSFFHCFVFYSKFCALFSV